MLSILSVSAASYRILNVSVLENQQLILQLEKSEL